MPAINFVYEDDNSGRIKAIYRDGELLTTPLRVESPNVMVQTYYKAAFNNLEQMTESTKDRDNNRRFGLQAFLMSLVGLEAFVNVHFHIEGKTKNLPSVISSVTGDKHTVESKIKNLSHACYGKHITDSKAINRKVRELYDLRSAIVHPKYEPITLGMSGIAIDGMSDCFQFAFEDREFVRTALRWCLLTIGEVCTLACDSDGKAADIVLRHWTAIPESIADLREQLLDGGANASL